MDLHGIGDVALAVGVSVGSIRNWTDEPSLKSVLSDSATRNGTFSNAKERQYTIDDVYVLHTVNKRKNRNNTWEEIVEYINVNGPDDDLPASASLIIPTQAASFADKLVLRQQLHQAQNTIEELKEELDKERSESKTLERQIGRLEMKVEMLEEEITRLKGEGE